MFLFDKKASIQELPWKHIVIDDALPKDIADQLDSDWINNDWPIWKDMAVHRGGIISNLPPGPEHSMIHHKFFVENYERSGEILSKLCDYFNYTPEGEIVFDHYKLLDYPPVPNRIIRPWHVDTLDKVFHMIYYIGEDQQQGNYELVNEDGVFMSYPFKHNRLIAWHNVEGTRHRFFYGSTTHRKTISLCFKDKTHKDYIQDNEIEEHYRLSTSHK